MAGYYFTRTVQCSRWVEPQSDLEFLLFNLGMELLRSPPVGLWYGVNCSWRSVVIEKFMKTYCAVC